MSIFRVNDQRIYLRKPFVGLLETPQNSLTLVIFILFMLSSTAFDGLHSTVPWFILLTSVGGDIDFKQWLGLLLSLLLFLLVYLSLVGMMKSITKSRLSLINLASQFSFSLIPIALVYNIAHYFTLLINQGQQIVRLISDPFGLTWNLFGTANFEAKLFLEAGFIWHAQVALILFGHIVAVVLSHFIALRVFKSKKVAILSQIPMLILMIIYTSFGLWILSQPITTKI